MVYKKYVYKRGRKHGPYYYHSYRQGGEVRKEYIGGKKEYREWLKNNKNNKGNKINNSFFGFSKVFLGFLIVFLLLVSLAGFYDIDKNENNFSYDSDTGFFSKVFKFSEITDLSLIKSLGKSIFGINENVFGEDQTLHTDFFEFLVSTYIDAYDLEDDYEDFSGWFDSEQETLPKQQEYFFVNYTDSEDNVVENASCNITIDVRGVYTTNEMYYNDSIGMHHYNTFFDYPGSYPWNVTCISETYLVQNTSKETRIRIPLENQSSLGTNTSHQEVNDEEDVELRLEIPSDDINPNNTIDSVWAVVTNPQDNQNTINLAGSEFGGEWNGYYPGSSILGNYNVEYFSQLSNGFDVSETTQSTFSVQEVKISINTVDEINTTDTINVKGKIQRFNGTHHWNITNNPFLMLLNNSPVASDSIVDSDLGYTSINDMNITNNSGQMEARLRVNEISSILTHSDSYNNQDYLEEAIDYENEGWVSGRIFDYDEKDARDIGNLTYEYTSDLDFYNATVTIQTSETLGIVGNTSILYSFDNSNWSLATSATTTGTHSADIPVNGRDTFYIMLKTDYSQGENFITDYELNYTTNSYAEDGNFVSEVLYIPDVTYTDLRWEEEINGTGNIKFQFRESSDNLTWSDWGENLTNSLGSDISDLREDYIQYRVFLETSSYNETPVLRNPEIFYFNATTDSVGNYSYNVTVPTNDLGQLPLDVILLEDKETGLSGINTTFIDVWSRTHLDYFTESRYYHNVTEYRVFLNYSRSDINELVNGSVYVTLRNSTYSSTKAYTTESLNQNSEINLSSPVAYKLKGLWHLDESSGDAIDSSGNDYNGSVEGATQGTQGLISGAYDFDGLDDYINLTDYGGLRFNKSFTVSMWINSDSWKQDDGNALINQHYFNPGNSEGWYFGKPAESRSGLNFMLYRDGSGFGVYNAGNLTQYENRWIHLAGVYDSEDFVEVYLNGELIGRTPTNIESIDFSSNNLIIGKRSDSDQQFFNGSMDEVALWDRALTTGEINDLYQQGKIGTKSQVKSVWRLPSEIKPEDYIINITGRNRSAYYNDATLNFFTGELELSNTTGELFSENKTLDTFTTGAGDQSFLHEVTITNTGKGEMDNVSVWNYEPVTSSRILDVEQISGCNDVQPGESCDVTMNITIDGSSSYGEYRIGWRAEWIDNYESSKTGGSEYIEYLDSYIIIPYVATLDLSISEKNMTLEHGTSENFSFIATSNRTANVEDVNITFVEQNISTDKTIKSSWVDLTNDFIYVIFPSEEIPVGVNISVPAYQSPGNYSGIINASSANGGTQQIILNVEVPLDSNWTLSPGNFSYNKSFGINQAGEIANYTLRNTGNKNFSFDVDYEPSGEMNYEYFNVFTENFQVGSYTYNPTEFNVSKNSSKVLRIYQEGYNEELAGGFGIITKINNSQANPNFTSVEDVWYYGEQPPEIKNIWFYLDGEAGDIAEVNKNLDLKVYATDDVDLNLTGTYFNISWEDHKVTVPAERTNEFDTEGTGYIEMNYTGDFVPNSTGVHSVVAEVYDSKGYSVASKVYNFTSVGRTSLDLFSNVSEKNITNVDLYNSENFTINYTITNTGVVSAYDTALRFIGDNKIDVSRQRLETILADEVINRSVDFEVLGGLRAGTYEVTERLTWRNPDESLSSTQNTLTLNIKENKSLTLPSSIIEEVIHGTQEDINLELKNTGNTNLSDIDFQCYSGDLCELDGINITFNNSNFDIPFNESETLRLGISVEKGYPSGNYIGTIAVSEEDLTSTISMEVIVPDSKTWEVDRDYLELMRGLGVSGTETINITNTGNVNFTFDLSSTNTTIAEPNTTNIELDSLESKEFLIYYEAPETEGNYPEYITVLNNDFQASPPDIDIIVNLTATQADVDILQPTNVSPLQGVVAGDTIDVHANLSYQNNLITDNATWEIFVNEVPCQNLSYEFNSNNVYWDMSCLAPDLEDAKAYDLSLIARHDSFGYYKEIESESIIYMDVTPPQFNTSSDNINLGENISVRVNATDNVNISELNAYLSGPNSLALKEAMLEDLGNITNTTNIDFNFNYDEVEILLEKINTSQYKNDTFFVDEPGEYIVNYTANDTTGNFNYTYDWFEVYDNYTWTANLTRPPIEVYRGVEGVNISFYRPNTENRLFMNTTNEEGVASFEINKRYYGLESEFDSGDSVRIKRANFTNATKNNMSLNMYILPGDDLHGIIPLNKPLKGFSSNSTGFENNPVDLVFNYTGMDYNTLYYLSIMKCDDWIYENRKCNGSWTKINSSRDIQKSSLNSENARGFSAYFLTENKCGNGLCEPGYYENHSNCDDDCDEGEGYPYVGGGEPSDDTTDDDGDTGGAIGGDTGGAIGGDTGGAIGGGGGDVSGEEGGGMLNVGGVSIYTSSIYKELFAGEFSSFRIALYNSLSSTNQIEVDVTGDVIDFITFKSTDISLDPDESTTILGRINIPRLQQPGTYEGDIIISKDDEEVQIPTTIRVLRPEGKLLDVKIQPLDETVAPGELARFQTDLLNLGETKRVDVQFDLQLVDLETGEVLHRSQEAFAVETSVSEIKNLTIPEWVEPEKYMIKGTAFYSNPEVDGKMQASSITYIRVSEPLLTKSLFGIPLWAYLLGLLFIAAIIGVYMYIRYLEYRKKRFKTKVDMNKLPKAGPNAAFVGKVAETGVRAFMNMNKLQTHTLVAGSTGSGKTVAAQDIIEEALLHKKSVIVFDPTAQWTGFLRKCKDKKMLKRYRYFDMKKKSAKAFDGSIKTIDDPYELINIEKYMDKPGEITVFNVSNLDPKEIDLVVASTIEQVFKSKPEEQSELKTMLVYDEVHRLLPKFGGSGEGFVQLERGAREFRKWGIGLLLISQVLSDFVGEVKANIGTEVQMGTRYEGDLNRVKMKYGEDILKSVVKEPVGTGMVVNAEYNSGKPYFIAFRPILHNPKRLSEKELKKYQKYFDLVEDLEYQIEELKKEEVDTMDLEMELKLARNKVKQGQFQMVDMYTESLQPRLKEEWKKLGKKPKHPVKKRLKKDTIKEGIQKAKSEREKYINEGDDEQINPKEDIKKIKEEVSKKKKNGVNTSNIEKKLNSFEKKLDSLGEEGKKKHAKKIKDAIEQLKKEVKGL